MGNNSNNEGKLNICHTGMHSYGCSALERQQQQFNRIQPFIKDLSNFYDNINQDRKSVTSQILGKEMRNDDGWIAFPKHALKSMGVVTFCGFNI